MNDIEKKKLKNKKNIMVILNVIVKGVKVILDKWEY